MEETFLNNLDVTEIASQEEKEEFVSVSPFLNVDNLIRANIDKYKGEGRAKTKGMTQYGGYKEIGTTKEKEKTEELADYFYVAPEA